MHWGNEIHTNVQKSHLRIPGFVDALLSSAKASLCKLVQRCNEFLKIEDSFVSQVQLPMRPSRHQVTDSSNVTIDSDIPLRRAGTFAIAYVHGLDSVTDMLPHFIMFPLGCEVTLHLWNPHGFCCLLADSNTSVRSPDFDILRQNMDYITNCDDWFWQPEDIRLYLRFRSVATVWVVDIKCLFLSTSVRSVKYIVKGDAMR